MGRNSKWYKLDAVTVYCESCDEQHIFDAKDLKRFGYDEFVKFKCTKCRESSVVFFEDMEFEIE